MILRLFLVLIYKYLLGKLLKCFRVVNETNILKTISLKEKFDYNFLFCLIKKETKKSSLTLPRRSN